MKHSLAWILLVMFGSCVLAEEASLIGDWIEQFSEDEAWKRFATLHPKSAERLEDKEKKDVIKLAMALINSRCWSFKADGSFELHSTVSEQLLKDIKAVAPKFDPTEKERKRDCPHLGTCPICAHLMP